MHDAVMFGREVESGPEGAWKVVIYCICIEELGSLHVHGYEVQTFGRLFVYMCKVLSVTQHFYVVYCTLSIPVKRSIALTTGIAQG